MDGFGMGWGIVMMVVMLVLIALVIVGVIWLVQRVVGESGASRSDARAPESGLEMLERRFAEGEIDVDEYRERRSVLKRDG